MSPERISAGCGQTGEGYSYPADIWGLGLSLLALALGRHPLAHVRTVWDVLAYQDAVDALPSLRSANTSDGDVSRRPTYTADLCDFVECCLQRDPSLRLNADELLRHPFMSRHSTRRPRRQSRSLTCS